MSISSAAFSASVRTSRLTVTVVPDSMRSGFSPRLASVSSVRYVYFCLRSTSVMWPSTVGVYR